MVSILFKLLPQWFLLFFNISCFCFFSWTQWVLYFQVIYYLFQISWLSYLLHLLMMTFALIRSSESFHLFWHPHKNSACPSEIFRVKQIWVLSYELDVDLIFVLCPSNLLRFGLLYFIFLILIFLPFLFLFNFLLSSQNLKTNKALHSLFIQIRTSLFTLLLFFLPLFKTPLLIIHASLSFIPKIISHRKCWLNIATYKLVSLLYFIDTVFYKTILIVSTQILLFCKVNKNKKISILKVYLKEKVINLWISSR